MTKGKPWPSEDEKKLTEWVTSGIGFDLIVLSFDGKYSKNGVQQKMLDLGLKLKEEVRKKRVASSFELPVELPSVEEALKTLSAALKALETPGLDQAEVVRLRCIISGVKIYKELFADYVDYRGIEAELLELNAKFTELAKKSPDTNNK
jgi:hypothetical protein